MVKWLSRLTVNQLFPVRVWVDPQDDWELQYWDYNSLDKEKYWRLAHLVQSTCLISKRWWDRNPHRQQKIINRDIRINGGASPFQGEIESVRSRHIAQKMYYLLSWWNGRHEGLKIPWAVMSVQVRVLLGVQNMRIWWNADTLALETSADGVRVRVSLSVQKIK